MGGFDDHGGIIGDWMPPSPSPRSFFAAVLGDDPGSRSVPDPPKNDTNKDTGFTFPGPNPQIGSENGDATKSTRAGHNAPRLNTEIIKSSDNSQTQQSPYLFSPGVSPTSFLESPVFLSNSLVQPSPTTGKFQFVPNGNGRSSMMFLDSSNRLQKKPWTLNSLTLLTGRRWLKKWLSYILLKSNLFPCVLSFLFFPSSSKDHQAIDILLAEINIYELFALKHYWGRRA
ncbi:unnamed protein product [Lactuca saligna]|uniref:Uncharacterized protein n=1 Tax=Lactuca saligna TaxID=75948 RepID=A0AA35ZVV3_LACSI|nr:unnamed protein product [Lactuca saligna]